MNSTKAPTTAPKSRRRRNEKENTPITQVVRVLNCTYEDGTAVKGLWEIMSIDAFDMVELWNATTTMKIRVPLSNCEYVKNYAGIELKP